MQDDPLMDLTIKPVKSASKKDLSDLYKDAGWWDDSCEAHPEFLNYIAKDSAVFVGAFSKKKLIGMGRALSDRASDAYIQDVAVLTPYRGRGIGRQIIQAIIDELKTMGVDWIGLIAEPGTTPFYRELGFEILKDHVPLKYKE